MSSVAEKPKGGRVGLMNLTLSSYTIWIKGFLILLYLPTLLSPVLLVLRHCTIRRQNSLDAQN